jgi:hypothetical protein
MAYKGEHMYNCRAVPFDWKNASLIVVSGSKPNPCGHALARAGNYYFHIDGAREYPWYMAHAGYLRYLKENEKTELRRMQVRLAKPEAAQRKLEELSAKRWTWLLLPNNCASFVEEIFAAGGSNVSTWTNCPAMSWSS